MSNAMPDPGPDHYLLTPSLDKPQHGDEFYCQSIRKWLPRINGRQKFDRNLVYRRRRPAAEQQQQIEPVATGIEAMVCQDIARRQEMGIKKYGTTVADNKLSLRQWLDHAYQECLDQAIYLRKVMDKIDAEIKDQDETIDVLRRFHKNIADSGAVVFDPPLNSSP